MGKEQMLPRVGKHAKEEDFCELRVLEGPETLVLGELDCFPLELQDMVS